jgi:PKD repeat protein
VAIPSRTTGLFALLAVAVAVLPGYGAASSGPFASSPLAGHAASVPLASDAHPPLWLGGHIPAISVPAPGAVLPAKVNPNAIYSAEPAPMGLGDFGLTAGGSPYTYYTDRFEAGAHLGSLSIGPVSASTGNYTSFQLNVVVTMSQGSKLAEYWIQDVPLYDASNHGIYFEDNVWNLSGSNGLPTNSISGNGTVYKSGGQQYYADGPGSSYPGNDVYLTLPVNISVEVTASNLSGYTHVGFLYEDGYGWVTYDNVTFPWTKGWTYHGFEVNGSAYNPTGIFDDAEWVLAGPGGGSEDKDLASDFNMTLDYDNGHNLEAVPNAYDFGSDTAETVTNAKPSLPARAPTGAPADEVGAGSGSLAFLYGSAKVATVNVTAPVPDGSLLVNGTATPYRAGRNANLTLLPGSYRFADRNASTILASRYVSVSAGEYLALSFAQARFAPASADSLANVTANGTGFAPGAIASVFWPGNSTAQCNATVASNGTFQCSFEVPIAPNGSYNLTVSDNAASADKSIVPFEVTTNLTVQATASRNETETENTVAFRANASAGFPPYASYRWRFGDGATFNSSADNASHYYANPGNYTVNVTVTDRVGDTAYATVPVRVVRALAAAAPTSNRTSADVGQNATFSVIANGGVGPYVYVWQGLPMECQPVGSNASCTPFTVPFNYSIDVVVHDALGFAVESATLDFAVYARPTITSVTETELYVDEGGNLTLRAGGTPGAGGLAYRWKGLPSGCAGSGPVVACRPNATGPFTALVTAVDANGVVSGDGSLAFTIYPDPVVALSPAGPITLDAGQTLRLSAVVSGGSGDAAFRWSQMPQGCVPGNVSTIGCRLEVAGTADVLLTYSDRAGWTTSATTLVTISPALTANWVSAPEAPVDVGMPITLALAAAGGSGGVAYAWAGLPAGCAGPNGPALTCSPAVSGTFNVTVSINDSNRASVLTPALTVSVDALPSVASLAASPSSVLAGDWLTLSATLVGGTGPVNYRWSNLPAGCAAADAANLSCTPSGTGHFSIRLTVTDAYNRSSNATVSLTVIAPVLGLPPAEGYALILALTAAVAALALGLLLRRRRPAPGPAPAPAANGPVQP